MDTPNTATQQDTTLVTREEAIRQIEARASAAGISGGFKVFQKQATGGYTEVTNPAMLPDMVNMDEIRVSGVYDQAC